MIIDILSLLFEDEVTMTADNLVQMKTEDKRLFSEVSTLLSVKSEVETVGLTEVINVSRFKLHQITVYMLRFISNIKAVRIRKVRR